VGGGALFDEIGIHIRNSKNIILRNLHVRDVKKSGSPTSNGGDAIGMEKDVSNVWVDHCTLEASGGESDGFDALIDMKNNTKYVTVSYNHLKGSDRGGLVGSGNSDDQNNFITFHHHSFNNYFNGIRSTGINSRRGAAIRVENNYFENSRNPLGTFYDDVEGYWQVSGNFFASTVTWEETSDEKPAGPNPTSNTTVSIPYSYSLDNVACVPQIVLTPTPTPTPDDSSDDDSGSSDDGSDSDDSSGDSGTPTGDNLSIGAGSDGSGKGGGTSYGSVRDGDLSTYWSPSGSTGRISIKWSSSQTVASVRIIEVSGAEGNIGDWELVNNDSGDVLASGNGAGTINFSAVSLSKINFQILIRTQVQTRIRVLIQIRTQVLIQIQERSLQMQIVMI